MRRFGTALLIASSASLVAGYAAVPAAAGTVTSYSLGGSPTPVKTSTGKSLHLSVNSFEATGDQNISVTVILRSGSYSRGESHDWTFQVDPNDLDYNSSTGKGSLNTGNDIMPFGSLNLSFTKTSQSSSNCPDSGSTTTVKGTLKGTVDFDTQSTSWGTVHATNLAFATPNYVSLNNSCTGEPTVPLTCSKYISWSSPYQPGGAASAYGFSVTSGGKTKTTISGSRLVYLTNDYSVSRSDYVSDAAPKPTIVGKKITIKTKSGSRASGSATISGGTVDKHSVRCKLGSKHFHEHQQFHSGGNWSSPHGLKFNETAFADFKSATGGQSPNWITANYS